MGLHAALQQFSPIEEISIHGGHRTLLAKSKAGSLVVIEILAESKIPDEVASSLTRAASTAARLSNEAIVQSRAFVLEPDLAAVISEFVPGVSLQRLLRFATSRGVRLPDDIGFYLVSRVLFALAYGHAAKDGKGQTAPVVHGNPQASSVVVGWDGTTKLGDFGGDRMRALVAPLVKVTPPEEPEPVAPEIARGGAPTERSDVFSAALLALRVATGRTPYARFRDSEERFKAAMSEGQLSKLEKTRSDLPAVVRDTIDRALEPDPEKRTVTAQEMLDAVRAGFDLKKGKEALLQLLERWRKDLQGSVTPWEKRGSISDDENAGVDSKREAVLAIAMADDRPSVKTRVAERDEGESFSKRPEDIIPKEELALAPTEIAVSMSRLGVAAPAPASSNGLSMPPLPPMRITAPSVPVYGGPAVNLPVPVAKQANGKVVAISIFLVFVALIAGAIVLFKFLSGPSP